ncbi:MAG TPA: GNAT family N-acetyltransferase [Opitutaceae bacterium]|jgi:ribosomal protein S18 acetylase RimI-like enzyme|nr:GNAT family N-acetyltransferase [Opitutaceae bacterium]
MQAEIPLRPLRPSDYPSVVALWRRCDGVEIAEGDDEASFRSYLERNPGLSCCAEAGGVLAGAALCGHDGRRGLIYHLAVAPEFRGRGLGRALLERGLAGLRERGIARVLILVAKDNAPGREFWLAQGFEAIAGAMPYGLDLK